MNEERSRAAFAKAVSQILMTKQFYSKDGRPPTKATSHCVRPSALRCPLDHAEILQKHRVMSFQIILQGPCPLWQAVTVIIDTLCRFMHTNTCAFLMFAGQIYCFCPQFINDL